MLVLTSLERDTSCLQNTLILPVPISQDTMAGGSALYNTFLGHQCPAVAKG